MSTGFLALGYAIDKGAEALNDFAKSQANMGLLSKTTGLSPGVIKSQLETYKASGVEAAAAQKDIQALAHAMVDVQRPFSELRQKLMAGQQPGLQGNAMLAWINDFKKVAESDDPQKAANKILEAQETIRKAWIAQGRTPEFAAQAATNWAEKAFGMPDISKVSQYGQKFEEISKEAETREKDRTKAAEDYLLTTNKIATAWERIVANWSSDKLSNSPLMIALRTMEKILDRIAAVGEKTEENKRKAEEMMPRPEGQIFTNPFSKFEIDRDRIENQGLGGSKYTPFWDWLSPPTKTAPSTGGPWDFLKGLWSGAKGEKPGAEKAAPPALHGGAVPLFSGGDAASDGSRASPLYGDIPWLDPKRSPLSTNIEDRRSEADRSSGESYTTGDQARGDLARLDAIKVQRDLTEQTKRLADDFENLFAQRGGTPLAQGLAALPGGAAPAGGLEAAAGVNDIAGAAARASAESPGGGDGEGAAAGPQGIMSALGGLGGGGAGGGGGGIGGMLGGLLGGAGGGAGGIGGMLGGIMGGGAGGGGIMSALGGLMGGGGAGGAGGIGGILKSITGGGMGGLPGLGGSHGVPGGGSHARPGGGAGGDGSTPVSPGADSGGGGGGDPVTAGAKGRVDPAALNARLTNLIGQSKLAGYMPPDAAKYGFKTGSAQEWANLMTGMAGQESGFKTGEVGDVGHFGSGSRGLFQLSAADAQTYGLQKTPFTAAQMADPDFNARMAVKIAEKRALAGGVAGKGGMADYWAGHGKPTSYLAQGRVSAASGPGANSGGVKTASLDPNQVTGAGAGSSDTGYAGVGGFNFMGSARAKAMGMDVAPASAEAQQVFHTGLGGKLETLKANKYAGADMVGFLQDLNKAGAPLKDFSGVYEPREKRGGGSWSQHAYGNAMDIETGFGKAGLHGLDSSPGLAKWAQEHPDEFAQIQAAHHLKNLDQDLGHGKSDFGHFEWSPTGKAQANRAVADNQMTHQVNGTGKISVDVKAPANTRVAAAGGGLFKKTEITRQTQMEPAKSSLEYQE